MSETQSARKPLAGSSIIYNAKLDRKVVKIDGGANGFIFYFIFFGGVGVGGVNIPHIHCTVYVLK